AVETGVVKCESSCGGKMEGTGGCEVFALVRESGRSVVALRRVWKKSDEGERWREDGEEGLRVLAREGEEKRREAAFSCMYRCEGDGDCGRRRYLVVAKCYLDESGGAQMRGSRWFGVWEVRGLFRCWLEKWRRVGVEEELRGSYGGQRRKREEAGCGRRSLGKRENESELGLGSSLINKGNM
ncbi:hypothetical protein HAX54_035998, partial [Datura stramonium]|nr:hypothetical protein [Datura stramonium]